MELCKPTIIVIAYNRTESVKRLLKSLENANYPDDVRLIISIDKSENDEVGKLADAYDWSHGEKIVIKHPENMGLKAHVLSCGDLSEKYGSVILLEDDLYVSTDFYNYCVQALDFVKDDKKIAGISLYNHLLNVHVREPFEAINDGYDNWYFQFASSWGQVFSKEHWQGFREYLANNNGDVSAINVPKNVSSWSDKSWLKHYIKYMIDNDMYFLYPRVSLSTNFAEEGTHAVSSNDDLQVPLVYASLDKMQKAWNFSKLENSRAKYDAFFENIVLSDFFEKNGLHNMQIDLYGYKEIDESKYNWLISSKPYPYKVKKSFGRHLRPIDANIFENIVGNAFYLYDLNKVDKAPKINVVQKLLYNYRAFKAKYGLDIIKYRLKNK